MQIALVQINVVVGDVVGNGQRMIVALRQAQHEGADVVVFSEQVIPAYPAEDLLLREDFLSLCQAQVHLIAQAADTAAALISYPLCENGVLFNACSLVYRGEILATYRKQKLPNYLVFDEQRYFSAGHETVVVEFKGVKLGLLICEDLWHAEPMAAAKRGGAQIILSPNGSPWHQEQASERRSVLQARNLETGLPIVYVNQVGGQDELIFDGRSQVWFRGQPILRCAAFAEDRRHVRFADGQLSPVHHSADDLSGDAEIYNAIVLSLRDYVQKNGFRGVILGLSGGIDSALTLAIAHDALGANNVRAVMMPYRYTADMSIDDAKSEAEKLGVQFDNISIAPMVESFLSQLHPFFEGTSVDLTEQNLQARCRGTLLMALSNKFGYLVLTTGNKSEMGVGYATLYGDMAGGFDVLKDVPKMLVYRLSEYRNRIAEVIPNRVIERPPSAELAPDQKDEDNLPPYPILDRILQLYIEQDWGAQAIIDSGIERETVLKVLRMVERNEYKRRQAALGPRISKRAFGRDRRYPITSRFNQQPTEW